MLQIIYVIACYRVAMRAIFGYEFMVYIYDEKNLKKYTIKHCVSYQDALEWMQAASNDDAVKIVNRSGYFVSQRG